MKRRLGYRNIAKGALAGLVGIVLGYTSAVDARIAVARRENPAALLRWRPDDAVALAKSFDRKLQNSPQATVSDVEFAYARRSLVHRPLSRTSLRLIGLWAASHNDLTLADRAMGLSERVSRRDVPTQLWLIERSAQKNEVANALAHYHAILSVSPRSRTILFPILTAALSDGAIRTALAPYIARQTNWSTDLLGAAIGNGDPRNVVAMLLPVAPSLRKDAFQVTNSFLVSRLVETGDVALAQGFVRAIWPELAARSFATFGLTPATTDRRLGAFAWSFNTSEGVRATRNDSGGFNVNVNPLTREVAASRVVPIEGGRSYLFAQSLKQEGSMSTGSSMWRAFCLQRAAKIQIWEHVISSSEVGDHDRSRIDVPKGCDALEFVLTVNGPDGQSVGEISVEALELTAA